MSSPSILFLQLGLHRRTLDNPMTPSWRNYTREPHEFSDDEAAELLRRLFAYIEFYDHTEDSITSLATELAQSLDCATDAEDEMRRELEARFHVN